MAELVFLSEEDVSRLLPLAELARSLSDALVALSEGKASVPARVAAQAPGGLLGAMPGYVPGLGLASKLVTIFSGNSAPPPPLWSPGPPPSGRGPQP
ncbi:MAG TPA: hypothetical protein VME20_06975 [Acidimicrobiales bacterium]|nr:hypothetical protein [Acidimicrobiales bacterium]